MSLPSIHQPIKAHTFLLFYINITHNLGGKKNTYALFCWSSINLFIKSNWYGCFVCKTSIKIFSALMLIVCTVKSSK